MGVVHRAQCGQHTFGRLRPAGVDTVELGVLGQQGTGDAGGVGRVGETLLGHDLDVREVFLDRGDERCVALIGDVVLRGVKHHRDRAFAAQRLAEGVGGLLTHLEQVVGDNGGVLLAVGVTGRDVG